MRAIFTAILGVLAGIISLQPARAGDLTPAGPFKITATVSTNRIQLKKPFTLHLKVQNVSATTQEFETLVCSWWVNWTLASDQLQFPTWDCDFKPPYKVVLRPGVSWTNDVDLKIGKPLANNHISFRAGFSPSIVNPNRDKNPTYLWSNQVKLELVQ